MEEYGHFKREWRRAGTRRTAVRRLLDESVLLVLEERRETDDARAADDRGHDADADRRLVEHLAVEGRLRGGSPSGGRGGGRARGAKARRRNVRRGEYRARPAGGGDSGTRRRACGWWSSWPPPMRRTAVRVGVTARCITHCVACLRNAFTAADMIYLSFASMRRPSVAARARLKGRASRSARSFCCAPPKRPESGPLSPGPPRSGISPAGRRPLPLPGRAGAKQAGGGNARASAKSSAAVMPYPYKPRTPPAQSRISRSSERTSVSPKRSFLVGT